MKGTSKVIMGATLVMVVTLAIVIALILVLLAELYCSLLLRRRHHLRNTTAAATTTTQTTTPTASPSHAPHSPSKHPLPPPPPPPPQPIYAPGVLQAPRSFLFPCMKEDMVIKEPNNHHHHRHCELLHKVIHIQTQESNSNVFVSSPPISISPFMSRAPPQKDTPHDHEGASVGEIPSCHEREQLVYISNPIYENEEGKTSGVNTPFETPDTSPSRLEGSGSSGNDDDDGPCDGVGVHSPTYTPPLTPMKKLPAEASSVSLRDARSLGTSASDSRSTVNGPSSSSSDSPCTSPSW